MTRWTGRRRVRIGGSRHVPDAIVAKGKLDDIDFWDMGRRGRIT